MVANGLPYFARGIVIKGFGRGSKQLGIPTANFPETVVNKLPAEVKPGVYCGWAQVDDGNVFKMVMSIGWNPYYKNIKKSMEVHILNTFDHDFYGATLKVWILKYLRPEMDFSSLDELIEAIKNDISSADRILEENDYKKYKDNDFFKTDQQFTQ